MMKGNWEYASLTLVRFWKAVEEEDVDDVVVDKTCVIYVTHLTSCKLTHSFKVSPLAAK